MAAGVGLQGETSRVRTRVGELSVTRYGSGDEAVLLWHSLFLDGRSWTALVPELSRTHRVLVVDGPGHGASGDPGRRYTIEACADAAVEVLQALAIDRVHWVGNAWGGHVGIALAARQTGHVLSLCTMSTPLHALPWRSRVPVTLLVRLFERVGWRRWLLDKVVNALILPEVQRARPEVPEYVKEAVRAPGRDPMLRAMQSVMLARPSYVASLVRVSVPVLLIVTEDEGDTAEAVRLHMPRLANGRLEMLAGSRHIPPLEVPEQVGPLLADWLAGLRTP